MHTNLGPRHASSVPILARLFPVAVRARVMLVALIALVTAGAAIPAGAQAAVGTSAAGIVPIVIDEGPGGNATCSQIPLVDGLLSSARHDWQGGRFSPALPSWIDVVVTGGTSVAWTSTLPLTAVIVKGSSAANVYLYDPMLLADSGLVPPVNASGSPAELSNLTFCWDPNPPEVGLLQLCLEAAAEAGIGPIVSVAGPIAIRDGSVDTTTVPVGVDVTYDAPTDRLSFTAPFPVVVAVTAASVPVVHLIDPPAPVATVPLASDSGDGELLLCGLDSSVIVSASCAEVGADAELGPVPVVNRTVEPALVPNGIAVVEVEEEAVRFEATVPVVGVVVEASAPVLYAFPEPVLVGVIPIALNPEGEAALVFCVLRVPGGGNGSDGVTGFTVTDETTLAGSQDPTEIATGSGPSGRTILALVAFVALALTGSSTLLLWSRSG
jgi:hypothetical protein